MCEQYNGWKNFPTWAAHQWLIRDTGIHNHCQTVVREARERDVPRGHVADTLKRLLEGRSPLTQTETVYAHLLNWAIAQIDWLEIADAFLEDN